MEQQENAAKQRRLQGSNVYYGDLIQLRHTLTGKYVCTSTTTTSITENTKLRVRVFIKPVKAAPTSQCKGCSVCKNPNTATPV